MSEGSTLPPGGKRGFAVGQGGKAFNTPDDPPIGCHLLLQLDSKPENLILVRSVLSGLCEGIGLDPRAVEDLRTAVSEACNNVVQHAYPDGNGPMTVAASWDGKTLQIDVEDEGQGIAHVTVTEGPLRLGLAIITSLADRSEFGVNSSGNGARTRMQFDLAERVDSAGRRGAPRATEPSGAFRDAGQDPIGREDPTGIELPGEIVVWLRPVSLLDDVCGRLLRSLAGVSRFTVPSVNEVGAVCEVISHHVRITSNGPRVGVGIAPAARRLNLTFAPLLTEERRSELSSEAELAASWKALLEACDESLYEEGPGYDLLRIRIVDQYRSSASST